jgi:DNA integrity scanning protein DisA with diadenylate cyclase activity|tara:strand:+ start:3324 stop:3818 length:495 start_codon:yes stop_codon:yes gene_type:complete
MAHSIEVMNMEIDSNLLKSYRTLLSTTKDNLAHTQFTELVTMLGVKPTKKLENSYRSLFKTIDKYTHGDMPKLLNHRFLFEILTASPKKRERDLKRLANNYCQFIISAGSENTAAHRLTINRYAQTVETCINELTSLEIDRKDSNFSSLWIGELRERLDTKDNK